MIAAVKELIGGRGSNVFVFIDEASLQAISSLNALWLTGKCERIRLTD
jgi:hypothetical protein